MSNLVIRKEGSPQRCEICHLSDQLDPVSQVCQRCADIKIPVNFSNSTVAAREKSTAAAREKLPFEDQVSRWLAISFFLMGGAIVATVISGVLEVMPLVVIFGALTLLFAASFVILVVAFGIYMVFWVIADMLKSIYQIFFKRSKRGS
jgi:hypothetical protein